MPYHFAMSGCLACCLYISALCLSTDPAAMAAEGLKTSPIHAFSEAGPTAQVVRKLASAARLQGVLGFENLDGSESKVTLAVANADFGTILTVLCSQDPRYKLVETESPDVVNVIAAGDKPRGHEILDFRIPKLDIEEDNLAENLIAGLPDYSDALGTYLRAVYLQNGGLDPASPPIGATFHGDAELPRFSIHLTNISVRQVLNSIASQSVRIHRALDVEGRSVPGSSVVRVQPVGWEFRFVDPRGFTYQSWVHQLFRRL